MRNQIHTFIDFYKNKVELSFDDHFFSDQPKHVWVICSYEDQWLLTRHLDRGYEFPGGKVEEGETPDQAAIREVYEETGGIVQKLTYIGQYKVTAKQDIVIKNIYFAKIKELEKQQHYFETEGPILLQELPDFIRSDATFSFIMKDDVLSYSLDKIRKEKLG